MQTQITITSHPDSHKGRAIISYHDAGGAPCVRVTDPRQAPTFVGALRHVTDDVQDTIKDIARSGGQ